MVKIFAYLCLQKISFVLSNNLNILDFFIVQGLNSKLGITLRVTVTLICHYTVIKTVFMYFCV